MAKVKCKKVDYKRASDDQLDSKADAVVLGLTNHAVDFPAPPISAAALQDLLDTYEQTYTAYKRGGLDQKEDFLNAKTDLLNAMDSIADYVDSVAKGNGSIITNGGFVPTKNTSTPQPAPVQPLLPLVTRSQNRGEVFIECPVVEGAEYYGMVFTEGSPLSEVTLSSGRFEFGSLNSRLWIDVTKARKKTLKDMKVGILYYFYMYAGNSAGVSTLSDGVSIMGV